ncbi:uncharacterized protein LOC115924273 [Strongylocentrotus purpuratus]|uniref:Kazal-like domain-containing protein n=1 Tax=Strongylocentrotus purpuratus TaxID=7668 RepID=A0A7M7NW08_STRPU|nr:uncharacterized protein LOC115924273 [Strongylocentrotus purpuratus]
MTRCSGRRKCSNTSDCSGLSTLRVRYECVCTERCGQVCQATPVVPHTRPGRCPTPTNVYDFWPFCRFGGLRTDCIHDAHCVENENMKCCQSTCGKECMPAASDVAPSTTTTTKTNSSSGSSIALTSSSVSDEELEVDFNNTTDVTTDITTNFVMTQEPLVDDSDEEDGDHEDVNQDDQSIRNSKSQRSSRETSRCKTGLRQRNKQGGGLRRCGNSINHPCYANGLHPLCGINGVSYANECYLLREQDRMGVHIGVRHRGYCPEEEEEGRSDALEDGLSKRNQQNGAHGCGIYTSCDSTEPRQLQRNDHNFIESIPEHGHFRAE